MNMHLAIHMKGFVSSPVIGKRIIIVITLLCAATFLFFFFFAPNFGAKAYAQDSNNTLILEDMRAIMLEQQRDISSIRNISSAQAEALTQMGMSSANMSSAQVEAFTQMGMSSTKLATQGAYTALSVFFLGLGLVIFGLKLTTRSSPLIGRILTILVWALTIPVIILVGFFQYGAITGNTLLNILGSDEPYFMLTFLMYIPIGILIFVLLSEKRIMHAQAAQAAQAQAAQAAQAQAAQAAQAQAAQAAQAQAAQAAQAPSQGKKDPYQELERLGSLKQQGLISEEEFQKLKMRLLSGI
jgi:Short C-terminal domain